MTDFFDVARPKIERLAVELNEVDGLTPAQIADVLLATALALGAGVAGSVATAGVLAALAGKIGRSALAEAPPGPVN